MFAFTGVFPRRQSAFASNVAPAAPEVSVNDPRRPIPPDVIEVVGRADRASAHLALLGDKRFIVPPQRDGFLMYRSNMGCAVAMGDPVGMADPTSLIEFFVWSARAQKRMPIVYQARGENLDFYRSQGLTARLLGQEAIVDLTTFSMQGSRKARLRQTLRRTERAGGVLQVVPARWVRPLLPDLQRISDAWLHSKSAREKSFSLGSFDPEYVSRTPVALVRVHGEIVAFANLWMGAPGGEVAVDMMRYTPDAPYGVMEYLFTKLFEWSRERGYSRFSLGMAPLAGLGDADIDPHVPSIWSRVGRVLRDRGEKYYNFEGVRVFKDKFRPNWEPRYLVAPSGAAASWAALSLTRMVGRRPERRSA